MELVTKYIYVCHQKYGYEVLFLLQSFFSEYSWQLVFPECRDELMAEAEKEGYSVEVHFETAADENSSAIVRIWQERLVFPGNEAESDKDSFGSWLYDRLREMTGKELPWGTLNGIRPTKLALQRLEDGQSDEEIIDYYKSVRRTSERKARLALDIAKREKEILSRVHLKDGYSLYIGIPFCPTTCLYCSFTSYAISRFKNIVDDYIDAVIKELEFTKEMMDGKILDTVYIGGGTPTTLEAHQLKRLIEKVSELFDMSTVKEFTAEAGRADSITREKLQVLKDLGVTRISINPQTFNQETLDFIGRRATVQQLLDIYPVAREIGFDNINMDLILGLPGEGDEEVTKTIEKVKELEPDSLTVHSLAIKRASRLSDWIKENGKTTLNNTDSTMEIAAKGAKSLGLEPYYLYRQKNMSGNLENIGFSKPGKYGIYNILIMEEVQTIIACGAGTVTKRVYGDGRIERCDNVKDVGLYIEKIDEMIERKRRLFEDEK